MNWFQRLDNPDHPNYVPRQFGPGEWTLEDFTDQSDDEEVNPFSFSADLVSVCIPFFGDCCRETHPGYSVADHGIVLKMLVEAGVCTEDNAESETSCFYAHYQTREEAQGFLDRFNAYLQKRLDDEPLTKALHASLVGRRAKWEARIQKAAKERLDWVPEAAGIELLESSLNDPDGNYVVMGKKDLDRIGELAKKLGFLDELIALDISIEKYEDVVKKPA